MRRNYWNWIGPLGMIDTLGVDFRNFIVVHTCLHHSGSLFLLLLLTLGEIFTNLTMKTARCICPNRPYTSLEP